MKSRMKICGAITLSIVIVLVGVTRCGGHKQKKQFVQSAEACLAVIDEWQAFRPDGDENFTWVTAENLRDYEAALTPSIAQLEADVYDKKTRKVYQMAELTLFVVQEAIEDEETRPAENLLVLRPVSGRLIEKMEKATKEHYNKVYHKKSQ